MYSTNISINHSEIEFLLNCGVSFPESFLNKLNNAHNFTTMMVQNHEWISGLVISEIENVWSVDNLVSYKPFKTDIGEKIYKTIIEFIESENISNDDVRIVESVVYDRNDWPSSTFHIIVRQRTIYKDYTIRHMEIDNKNQWCARYCRQW